jgi:glutamine synthetase type III
MRYIEDVDNYTKETAKTIALEVLEWAKAKGVTSFTFWIHPQTS